MASVLKEASSDPWTANAYKASSLFVPLLTSKVTQWLALKQDQRILDLGCGDGVLTVTLKPLCAEIIGLDSSPNLIAAAKKDYGHVEGIQWIVKDCRHLDGLKLPPRPGYSREAGYDQVFSNAALHWILRDHSTRESTIQNVFRLLRPGGTFVFEMGGPANVSEVHAALISALVHRGVSIRNAREACPWYFPSEVEMSTLLAKVGFHVERIEAEHRPTRLTEGVEGSGLEGWIRLHGDSFLKAVDERLREDMVKEVCEVLDSVISREEGEGGKWLGYVRLRALARKPVSSKE